MGNSSSSSSSTNNKTKIFLAIFITSFVTFTIALQTQTTASAAMGILKFTAPTWPLVAGSPVIVKGTSMPDNATHTNCNVQFQTNQAGYLPVTPLGPASSKYANWTATSQPLLKGNNVLEAQLQCFAPGSSNGAPILTKHLVHNVTADSGIPAPSSPLPQKPPLSPQ